MEGVILFVDDKIDETWVKDGEIQGSKENELFEALRKEYPVLGVKNLELAAKVVDSVGSFSAIILDWIFDDTASLLKPGEKGDEIKGVKSPALSGARTLEFLEKNDFYSLIYVYSDENVKEQHGQALVKKFGSRIEFEKKGNLKDPAKEIAKAITKWKEANSNLAIPLKWSSSINKSTQQIFKELSEADSDWIAEIYRSAADDGVSPELFVIEIFQCLLSENLVQNNELLDSVKKHGEGARTASGVNEQSIAKLYSRLFYSPLQNDAPIMTGDICKMGDDKYGVIITPECDVRRICSDENHTFELLVFEKGTFDKHITKTRALQTSGKEQNFTRARFGDWENGTPSQKGKLKELQKMFNQTEPRFHILPSFPFTAATNESAVIEFSLGAEMHTCKEVKDSLRQYKLNSPFIQQLRQRYIAYLGRVGTPSLPLSLCNWNLK